MNGQRNLHQGRFSGRRSGVAVVTVLMVLMIPRVVNCRGNSRKIRIMNESKGRVEIYWVHPTSGETVLMSNPDVAKGALFPLDSFVGHTFEIVELTDKKTGTCHRAPDLECRRTRFSVSDNDDQTARITNEIEIEFEDNKVKARQEASELLRDCQQLAKQRVVDGEDDAVLAMDFLIECVQGGVANTLERVNEEIAFQAHVRRDIAYLLENYTCMDDTLESSPDVESRIWRYPGDRVARRVHVKHERAASKIHVIENFIKPDECESMEQAAAKSLHRATVADGKGGSRLSENRKAMQAGIKVPWNLEKDDHPIARISRRVYEYTNHVLGLNIKENGQEDLMSIQYFGRGRNDTEPDRYTPHCDGDCTGLPHKHGTRMATMVMYCDVATSGGHTNFRNAGVHVKPESGNGIFFSYVDPEALIMDTGFTEHSGCPVFEGTKKIVTQWIRLGVDDDNPWDSFNTLGIKISEMDEDDYSEDGEEYYEDEYEGEYEEEGVVEEGAVDVDPKTTAEVELDSMGNAA